MTTLDTPATTAVRGRTARIAGIREAAYRIRRNALNMGEVQGQGYIGQALGVADVLAVAYTDQLRYRADDPTSLSSDDVVAIYRDPAGPVWLGTYGGGLNRLDPATGKTERFTTSNSGLPYNVIVGLLPDDDGKLWMSTNGGGLVQLDPKAHQFLVYDSSDGMQDNEFNQSATMRSKSGELFFGGPAGFNAFFPRDIKRDQYVPPVVVTAFKAFSQLFA